MKLIIFNEEKKYSHEFVEYIIKKIAVKVLGGLDEEKLIPIDEYINNDEKLMEMLETDSVSSKEILRLGMKNLTYIDVGDSYTIFIDDNARLGRIKISALCELINYGNMSVKGYSIITDSMNEIADNFQDYVRLYRREKHRYERISI